MFPDNPQLLIIAGPNGAGKSTYSKGLSTEGAFIFDADKEAARIEALYPGLPGESISYAVEQYFLDCVEDALRNRTNFTVETNFRDGGLMNTVTRFKNNGYELGIIYIGLSDVKQSMDRVSARVEGGGHFVDTGSIHYNYRESLDNFEHFADRFEHIGMIDASRDLYELKPLLTIRNRQITFIGEGLPEWSRTSISELIKRFGYRSPDCDDDDKHHRRGPRR